MRFDLGVLLSLLMLIVWAVGALVYDGPGWIHLLLTVGLTVLIWRIVENADRKQSR